MKANMTIYWNVWTEFNYYNLAYDYGFEVRTISILIIKTKNYLNTLCVLHFVES